MTNTAYKLLHEENALFMGGNTSELAEKDEVLLNLNRQKGLPYISKAEEGKRVWIILLLIVFCLALFSLSAFALVVLLPKFFVIPIEPRFLLGYLISSCSILPVGVVSFYIGVQWIIQIYFLFTDFRQTANSRYLKLIADGIQLDGEVVNIRPELYPRSTLTYRFVSPSGKKIKSRYTLFYPSQLRKGDKVVVLFQTESHLIL